MSTRDLAHAAPRAALQAALQRYRCADENEAAHRARMLSLLATARGSPFRRSHFQPGHFTASGFILSPRGDALLLIRHPKLGRWLQPGGHVERGDSDLLAAARREVAEETGLQDLPLACEGIFDLDVHDVPALGAEPAHAHFDVRFAFQAGATQGAPAGSTGALFVTLAELTASGADADPSVTRAARKLLSHGSRRHGPRAPIGLKRV